MGELHSLVILHLVSVNVGFTEVNPRFAQRGLVQYSFRESLAIHVELEQDVLPSLDVLTGMNGYSGAEQHQFVIGRNDGIGHAGPIVDDWSSRVSLPGPVLPAPGGGLVPHEDLERVQSPVLASVVRSTSSYFFSLLFLQSFSFESADLRLWRPTIFVITNRLALH